MTQETGANTNITLFSFTPPTTTTTPTHILYSTILFGTLLYVAEGGTFYEPTDMCLGDLGVEVMCGHLYPQGAYLRPGSYIVVVSMVVVVVVVVV